MEIDETDGINEGAMGQYDDISTRGINEGAKFRKQMPGTLFSCESQGGCAGNGIGTMPFVPGFSPPRLSLRFR